MRDLRFVGVDDEGTRLLLVDDDGEQHQVEIDDALRSAVRAVRSRLNDDGVDPNVRPRDIQALLRSGLTIDEVAERTGWSTDKVGRFEPPIRAERDHVALTAQKLPLHVRVGGREQGTTVGERVSSRLSHRGVAASDMNWDAYRGDRGWTIECRFPAGGRARVATWRYDAQTQSLHPTDDEARWLSEDDQPTATMPFGKNPANSVVYDVVAEGGLDQQSPAPHRPARVSAPKIPHAAPDEAQETDSSPEPSDSADTDADAATPVAKKDDRPVDLVSVMRERSKNRRKANARRKGESHPSGNHPAGKQSAAAGDDTDGGAEEPDQPTVDELGHDPVTGTVDLFGLGEVEPLRHEVVAQDPEDVAVDEAGDDASEDASDHPDIEPGPSFGDDVSDADSDVDSDVDEVASKQVVSSPAEPSDGRGDDEPEQVVPSRPSQARKGRPSVPSWDDIMFGKRGPKE